MRAAAEMVEIRVDVTLTNAIDEGLVRRGGMEAHDVRSVQTDAKVDTGAIRTCIPASLAKRLGLTTVEHLEIELANGETETVELTEPLRIELSGRSTTESTLVLGNEVLIGQTVLETTDLLADCARQRLIPNPDHPNGPVLKVK
ncbi:hypothetical protein Pla175_40470 [Pirellulimonas nuda]|uniref:Clan AA aspartic protease n=1 Tax=Pirellulimonas nuda TaxID=2528009 RepID=A0A518DGP2_9BACT|nr:retroviral-like aspartic protease family protein [Pirellulimonas nuda]QDU90638.1 hypothetical protein Pla175_40470 [Pirellulimonas nuda]